MIFSIRNLVKPCFLSIGASYFLIFRRDVLYWLMNMDHTSFFSEKNPYFIGINGAVELPI